MPHLYPGGAARLMLWIMMWTLSIHPHPSGLHVALNRWERSARYPAQLIDFMTDRAVGASELGQLERAMRLAADVVAARRIAE